MPDTEEVSKQKRVKRLGKEPEMAYKKPILVTKSAPKRSFVAGCPPKQVGSGGRLCKECAYAW